MILYLDASMGAAGDMLAGALVELMDDPAPFQQMMDTLGLPGVQVSLRAAEKCGIVGTKVDVTVHGHAEQSVDIALWDADARDGLGNEARGHEHAHAHGHGHSPGDHVHEHSSPHDHGPHSHSHATLADVEAIIAGLDVPEQVRQDAVAVYRLIADAEAQAHRRPISQVHFHEVGQLDAIADVVAVCWLMDHLPIDTVMCTPVHVGSGHVACAHGIVPVPAPATALLLRGIPSYSSTIPGELCTPTGAALLRHFVSAYQPMPPLRIHRIGYGMGTKDFEVANAVRAILGETVANQTSQATVTPSQAAESVSVSEPSSGEDVVELACTIDDMTAEALAFAMDRLREEGALDVWATSVLMKKGRLGTMITVLADAASAPHVIDQIFRLTTTLGVREYPVRRHRLGREIRRCPTSEGEVQIKQARGRGVARHKVEYEDLAQIARRRGISLDQARGLIEGQLDL